MSLAWPDKDPNAVLDYQVDWTSFLGVDTIATSTWIVPAGITQNSASNTTVTTTIWLSSGTAGQTYELTNRITTAAGRTDDRTVSVTVREK